MTEQIHKILEEIFQIDPSLKKHEAELKKVMDEFIKQKPDTKFDEAFKEELKFKLLARAEELIGEKRVKYGWIQELFVPRNLSFAFAGVALSLVIVMPVFMSFMSTNEKFSLDSLVENKVQNKDMIFESGVINVANNAFGPLSSNQSNAPLMEDEKMVQTVGQGGGSPMTKIAFDESVNYEYIYKGEDFELNNNKLLVYKKVLDKNGGRDVSAVLKKFDFGVLNLDQFKNVKVNQISLVEEKEFGFYINVNFEASQISIYQNWNMWPRPDSDCRDEKCFESFRLKTSDVPDDKKIIAIADDFVKKLELDTSLYGEGVVQSYWRDNLMYETSENDIWIPDEMNVIYPLKFGEQKVYDTSGNVNGLGINVNIRYGRASGANQIEAQKYESSEYEAITDVETVMSEIKKGGFMNYQWNGNGSSDKTVQVELGEPTLDLIKYYNYKEDKQESEELLVPALIFPVKNVSETQVYYNRKAIVVPLIKEVLEENISNDSGVVPRPIIMIEPMEISEEE